MGEQAYLNLVEQCISFGDYRIDRTKVGTYSLFGKHLEFNLEGGVLPLLTTKKMFVKGILKELLWIMKGQTNSKILDNDGVKFWNDNSTRQFLDSRGLHSYKEGDLGPIYGFQWRYAGKEYCSSWLQKPSLFLIIFLIMTWLIFLISGNQNILLSLGTGFLTTRLLFPRRGGIDQLKDVVEQLKTNPTSRRMIICSWNVAQLDQMALPPCHCLVQFYVRNNVYLDCQLYQRSADIGLGVPFNIASYSLLMYVLAKWTNLTPGRFVHTFGDVHVYSTHVDALRRQIATQPNAFPTIEFKGQFALEDLENVTSEEWCDSFVIHNYKAHPSINMPMAI
jgi:thymidylate synthase